MAERPDNPFEPRLGRIRSSGYGRSKSFLNRVRAAASKAGPGRGSARRGKAQGGGGKTHARRVIVKARFIRASASSAAALKAHLDYLRRDGATSPENRGRLFNARSDEIDASRFVKDASEDRHHFRLIVSPEDGAELADMKAFTRELVSEMETALGTKLDWASVVHVNTEHPHAHIVIRGRRDNGSDLVMPRRYISHGIRESAEALATRELGPETQYERDLKLARKTDAARLTAIDRGLKKLAHADNTLPLSDGPARFRAVNLARLRKLQTLGLAEDQGRGGWRLADGFIGTLRELGERGDIIKTLNRSLAARPGRRIDPDAGLGHGGATGITGAVVRTGLGGEAHDRPFVVLDTLDGRLVQIGVEADHGLRPGMIVRARPPDASPRPSDRTIADIAARHGGVYSAALHQSADPKAGAAFIQAHLRRLERLRRAGLVDRQADGSWRIPADHLTQVERWQAKRAHGRAGEIDVLSWAGLSAQVDAPGPTWLDSTVLSSDLRGGFGDEVTAALEQRRAALVARGLLKPGEKRLSDTARTALEALGLDKAGREAEARYGKPYVAAPKTGRVEGVYRGTLETASGRFAVIDRGRDVMLTTWRPVMERARGQAISGIARAGRISWTFGRGRGRG